MNEYDRCIVSYIDIWRYEQLQTGTFSKFDLEMTLK